MRQRHALVGLVLALSLTLGSAQLILISRNQEIEIGKEVAKELEQRYGVWDDPQQTRRVERIGRSLVAVCDRKDMPYTFKILNERKELNAVTAPGGFIYITRALLEALDSDDELAFVLGHEIGHVCGDHIRKQLSQAMAGSLLLDILTGGASRIVQIGTDLMFALYQRGYSRQHERDADARGVRYMKAAGYNPIAAITALKKLGMERYRGINKWFATHPDVPERIQRIGEMLGVDPNTLKPLPKAGSATLEGAPERPTILFFVREGALYRLAPKASTPEPLWQLEGRGVERVQASLDGQQVWMLVREGKSALVHLARWQQSQPTRFLTSFYADTIAQFARSPDGRWLAMLGEEKGRAFVKVFDTDGREIAVTGRTPIGIPFAFAWAEDGRLLLLTERFGAVTLVTVRQSNTVQLTEVRGVVASPAQFAFGPPLWVLTGNTLSQVQLDGEWAQVQPILQSVAAFAVRGKSLAVVRDGRLWVGRWDGRQWQGATPLDERMGMFADFAWSADGQWLAYTYRASLDEPTQLWLAHLPTRRLWQVAVNASAPTFAD
ncbi:MAG: hypothetical protein SLRJCFUN_002243 [Candidatus Fervidibacter sp.]